MDAPVDVHVSFTPPPVQTSEFGLTVSVTGPGTVVGAGFRCGGKTRSALGCRRSFGPGSRVKLKAVPARGARFAGWTGFCQLAGRTTGMLVTVSTAKTVGAVFRR